jgi:outer membrane protein assembly factor BamB
MFVITAANELFAFGTEDGQELWTYSGLSEAAGLLGGAPAAVADDVVVAPFSSGELVALRAENGRVVWTESLTALRRTDPVSSLAHIRGAPVIDRGRVFAIGHSDRMVAIDLQTGVRIWEQAIGGKHVPWVAGQFIYILSNEGEVVCLSRDDGRIKWVTALQRFEDEEDKEDPVFWSGPVLAGDRLLVVGTLGEVLSLSPYTGEVLGKIDVSDAVRVSPIVANQTVYILTDRAELIALR